MLTGKAIFIKYWILTEPFLSSLPYNISFLPGRENGISGTSIMGNNIGIIKNISKEKKEAALTVLEYFTSKEYQRKLFDTGISLSSLDEIWNDEKVCKKDLCNIGKNMQIIIEPDFVKEGGDEYRKRYKNYIYQFLFENKTIEETQKHIIDITKIYNVELNTKDSPIGFIYFIGFSVVTGIMLLSLIFLFKKDFFVLFTFLSKDFWIITVLGSLLLLWTPIIDYGSITNVKYHLKILLMSIGFTLSVCPTLSKLIVQYFKFYKISIWIKDHRYLFLLCSILIDVLLNCITLIKPFTVKTVLIEDRENFNMCDYKGEFSVIPLLLYKLSIILLMIYITFADRNNKDNIFDIKFITSTIFVDVLSLILICVFYIIEFKNYVVVFALQTAVMSIVSISNYIFLYGCRIFIKLLIKEEDEKIEKVDGSYRIVIGKSARISQESKSPVDSNNTYSNVNFGSGYV